MNLILGTGMSGLTAAYTLSNKDKETKLINTSINFKNSNKIWKHLFHQNINQLNEKIKSSQSKIMARNCNITFSYSNGGLANIWGGAISDTESYDFSEFSVNKESFVKYESILDDIFSIISGNKIRIKEKVEKKLYNNFIGYNFFTIKKNLKFLENYLHQRKNIQFLNNKFVEKINFEKNYIELYDLKNNKNQIIEYQNLFLSCGSICTPLLLMNSAELYKKITLYETQHFSGLATLKKKNHKSFKINLRNKRVYLQFYDFNFLINYLFGINLNLLKKSNLYIVQLYLDKKNSGKIELYRDNDDLVFEGKQNPNLTNEYIDSLKNEINNSQDNFKMKKIFKSGIGSSNHIGCSFPMGKKNSIYSTNELGKLAKTNNVYIYDSSCLNDIDTQPISSINMLNIIRMIMENEKL